MIDVLTDVNMNSILDLGANSGSTIMLNKHHNDYVISDKTTLRIRIEAGDISVEHGIYLFCGPFSPLSNYMYLYYKTGNIAICDRACSQLFDEY